MFKGVKDSNVIITTMSKIEEYQIILISLKMKL